MAAARDIMTPDVTCVGEGESLADAAHKMAQLDVGSLPICGEDNRLKGMLTDRDIIVKAVARGLDPAGVTAGELAEGQPVTIWSGWWLWPTWLGRCPTGPSVTSWTPFPRPNRAPKKGHPTGP